MFSFYPFVSDHANYRFEFSAQINTIGAISCGLLYLARFSIVFSLRIASENIARSDETDAVADTDLGLAIECCECDSDIPSPLQISSAVIKRIAYYRTITTG